MRLKLNWDFFGISTSIACAIHCALLPLIAGSLPLFGINIIHNNYFEWGMILLAISIGTYSLRHGFSTHHHNYLPFILFFSGCIFLIFKQFFHQQQVMFLAPALTLIIIAHFLNFKYCRHSKVCNSAHHVH